MNWFVLAVLHMVGTSFANVLRKNLMREDKSDPVSAAILFQLLGTLIVVVFALARGFVMPPIATHPINFIFQAVFWGFATFCLFQAYKYIEASEATIIATSEGIVTIIVAVLILGEVFTVVNAAGAALIIFSVIFISYSSAKFTFNRGVIYALLYGLFAGFGIVNDTYMLQYSEVLSYLVIGYLTPALVIMIVKPAAIKNLKHLLRPPELRKHFIFTFVYVVSGLGFFYSLAVGGQASQVTSISQGAVILTVILSIIFLNEKGNLFKKLFCATLVTIGVVLLR